MSGASRRNRRRRQRQAELEAAEPAQAPHPPVDDGDEEAWPQSDIRAMRRDLLRLIHRYYLAAISRLPPAELRTALARGLLVGGHCFGPLSPVHNIIVNSVWYAAAFPLRDPGSAATDDDDKAPVLLPTAGVVRIIHRSLQGLVASLRHHCPSLSAADALYHLMNADANLSAAVAMANDGTTMSSAKQFMVPRNLAAFQLGTEAAGHPNPAAFARFASSMLPTVNAQHNVAQFLLMNHFLSAGDMSHLSALLVPERPSEPLVQPLTLRPQLLDYISSQKQRFRETGKQVLSVVDMAAQHYTLQRGERLVLHSVCGVSLRNDQVQDGSCYHINFLAYRKEPGSGLLGATVLLFTEAIVSDCNEVHIHLCVLVDPPTDIGCCFACETNKKMIVHPTYDDYLGCKDFEEDEIDCGGDFPELLDVDYIFFDADRNEAVVKYLDDRIGCNGIGYLDA